MIFLDFPSLEIWEKNSELSETFQKVWDTRRSVFESYDMPTWKVKIFLGHWTFWSNAHPDTINYSNTSQKELSPVCKYDLLEGWEFTKVTLKFQ